MRTSVVSILIALLSLLTPALRAADAPPDYAKDVAPILQKYCAGCHNGTDDDGEFVMDSFAALMKGGESGPAIVAGDGEASRMIRVLTGKAKPAMPPRKEPQPSEKEIDVLRRWIDGGAIGPPPGSELPQLNVPPIVPAANARKPITALAYSPDGQHLAVARFGAVELLTGDKHRHIRTIKDLPGKINALHFSRDGKQLVAATGVTGLYGKAIIWNVETGEVVRQVTGHRDALYDAELSPDGQTLATCSYDRRIILWNAATGEKLREIDGHNGAVFDLAFSPDGAVLASAGADETVKLWRVADGQRLDTLHQPEGEQYSVTFSPDGKLVLAGGADNRIRVWRFVSRKQPAINPLLHARFAHERAIVRLAFSHDGAALISAAEDGTLKQWETQRFTQTHAFETQPDVPAALAAAPQRDLFVVGRMDGSLHGYAIRADSAAAETVDVSSRKTTPIADAPFKDHTEAEPNDSPRTATPIELPATVKGVIHSDGETDVDLFRFTATAGQQWMLEINAARSKSPLDSRLEVLDAEGKRITRVKLQAVRDSYFTFRGKDSDTSDDFRVKNWQEMELNELLCANGEVVKLWHYPRGPDSGFMVYPGFGKRHTYFDTTPLAHPLHAPCYIVRPLPPDAEPIPNGLPVFEIYFENDDESERRWGADSQLMFTAPRDGEYLVRVSDVRGFSGKDFSYTLTVRPRRPGFRVWVEGANPTVNAGSGREFTVKAERIDGFDGEIRVEIDNAPPGFMVTSPVVIEAGQYAAVGAIHAMPDAPKPTAENSKATKLVASAQIGEKRVSHDAGTLGEIKLAGKPKLLARILPAEDGATKAGGTKAGGTGVSPVESSPNAFSSPLELTIKPGETITARVRVERNGFNGRVEFGNADAGRNLPHGVYVDNIGLNGLLIVEGQTERTFFITAAPWVKPTTRPFFLRAKAEGGQTTMPVLLRVVK